MLSNGERGEFCLFMTATLEGFLFPLDEMKGWS